MRWTGMIPDEADGALQLGVFGLVDDTHAPTTQPLDDPIMRNGLADLRHGSLRNGNSPTAMTSTGLTGIIIHMTEIEKAQSVALIGIADAHKPLRWP